MSEQANTEHEELNNDLNLLKAKYGTVKESFSRVIFEIISADLSADLEDIINEEDEKA